MNRTRPEIKEAAKLAFKAHYWPCVAVVALFIVIFGALTGTTWGVASIVLSPVLTVGMCAFFLKVSRGEAPSIEEFFTIPFSQFGRAFLGVFWMELFTFLWSLLFVIPGIIKALAYCLTPYPHFRLPQP